MTPITSPSLDYALLAPLIVVLAVACIGVLVEALIPRWARLSVQLLLTFLGVVIALLLTVVTWASGRRGVTGDGSVVVDGPTYFLWMILLVLGGISFLLFAERRLEGGRTDFAPQAAAVPGTAEEQEAVQARVEHTEVFPLALFALAGMMLFPASNDLITMFVALEVLSLPLYLLCGLARRRRLLSQEASLKYFLLGALSSAFFIYGVALLYGYAGSFELAAIDAALTSGTRSDGLLLAGMAMLGIGLLFKVGAVPFHAWTPDVYVGAPTPVTAFMAACTKIAAFGALLRVFYVALGGARWDWQPLLAIVAVATMLVGAVLAITQSDVKRMLAYSAVAHTGFLLTAVVGASQLQSGKPAGSLSSVAAAMFYLVAYGAASIGAFALVMVVRDQGGEATRLSAWAGLGRRSPLVAVVFSLFLLSFAGIPLTSGFIGKWSVFAAAWQGHGYLLVVLAVILSLVAAFFYLRIILVMFFEPATDSSTVVRPSWTTVTAIGVGAAVTVAFGIFPGPLLDLAASAGEFLR